MEATKAEWNEKLSGSHKDIEISAGIDGVEQFGALNTFALLCKEDFTKVGYYMDMEWESFLILLWRIKEKNDYEERYTKLVRAKQKTESR